MKKKELSTFVAKILRHQPEIIGISLDKNGWAKTNELVDGIKKVYPFFTMEYLDEIVYTDSKTRYLYSEDKSLIRANQGHSIDVDVGLSIATPPKILYHGTATKSLNSILEEGLKPMTRQYVHLSAEIETAKKVGTRHGEVVLLEIDTEKMTNDNVEFLISYNNVWLTKYVHPKYIKVIK